MGNLELDALPLEYQRDYGTASGELDISDFVNNPFINCKLSVSCVSLKGKRRQALVRNNGKTRD